MSPQLLNPDVDIASSATGADRRVHRRLTAQELRGLVSARMKYGASVKLIDLSVGGALVELPGKLVADASVVFEFAGPNSSVLVPSRVLRVHSLSHRDDAGHFEGAFVFKRPLALTDLIKEPASTCHKVVVRCRDARIVQGYTQDFGPTRHRMRISPSPFAEVSRDIAMADVDAVFFIREGPRTASEASAAQLGRRVAVTLSDGEVLTGTTLNYRRDGHGFFMHPADNGDAIRIFVTPWAIRNLTFL